MSWTGIGIAIGIYVVLQSIVLWALISGERSHGKARKGGCICRFGSLVDWIRSDCPYHGRKLT